MKIVYTVPGLSPHGGIRVIFEHINRLIAFGHEVHALFLQKGMPDWFEINPLVKIHYHVKEVKGMDVAVITSPHSIDIAPALGAKRTFLFCQMAEHLFRPQDKRWQRQCVEFYCAPYPMIAISEWNVELFKKFGRRKETFIIGNGVNLDHFPISESPKDGKYILVEGWTNHNPSKDPDMIAPRVAVKLREDLGVKVLAYSQFLDNTPFKPDEFHHRPDLKTMNDLYERATILIKASKYDARACAPMEAMTKGTVTARAALNADDDLIGLYANDANSIRCEYDAMHLYSNAKYLLQNRGIRERLGSSCRAYVQKYTWDYWMKQVNEILTA